MGISRRVFTGFAAAAFAAFYSVGALAQDADKPFEPTVGQEGKDVIWVPTPQVLVEKMLDMARSAARPRGALNPGARSQQRHRGASHRDQA